MKNILNKLLLGAFIGLLLPVLSIALFYLYKFSEEISVSEFLDMLLMKGIYTQVLSLCVYVSNMAMFFLFIKLDFLRSAKGVLLATIIYSIFIFIFKVGM